MLILQASHIFAISWSFLHWCENDLITSAENKTKGEGKFTYLFFGYNMLR